MDKQAFLKHVRNWDGDIVEKALAQDEQLANYIDQTGRSALHHCAATNHRKTRLPVAASIKTAATLLAHGADVNAIRIIIDEGEAFHASALWYAAAWGDNIELMKFLLENDSKPHNCMWTVAWQQDQQMAELLLSHGAEIDPVAHNETPLLQIVKARRWKLLNWLVAQGANINFQDDKGFTALHYAVNRGYTLAQVTDLLKLGADASIKDNDGESAISLATSQKRTKLAELLAKFDKQ